MADQNYKSLHAKDGLRQIIDAGEFVADYYKYRAKDALAEIERLEAAANKEPELLPCPFCGETPVVKYREADGMWRAYWEISCTIPGGTGPHAIRIVSVEKGGLSEATRLWNNRV